MRKLAVIASLVAMVGAFGASHADPQAGLVNVVIAPPASDISGVMTNANIVLSAPSTFINADIAPHNVVSDAVGSKAKGYYFESETIEAGQTAITFKSNRVEVGETYGFHCTVHDNMVGTLYIAA